MGSATGLALTAVIRGPMQHFKPVALVGIDERPLELAVVIPVLNEHDNVKPLLEKLSL